MREYVVVGSGVGGSAIAALLSKKGRDVLLLEKESYLGGCSSTFIHRGFAYNTGATTLVGYEKGQIVAEVLDELEIKPELIETNPSITIIQDDKKVHRYSDFESFFGSCEAAYPHARNRDFWQLVLRLSQEFYKTKEYYYSNRSIVSKLLSLLSYSKLFMKFFKYLFVDAKSFIESFYGDVTPEYMEFLDAQIMIVAQARSKEVNFLVAALALGYTFGKNHYVIGGFGTLFEQIAACVKEVRRNSEVLRIIPHATHYEVHLKDEVIETKNIILNTTIYDSQRLFTEASIKAYYKKYEGLNNHQSSFMLYMSLKCEAPLEHHYQILLKEPLRNTISNALFVSISDKSDEKISPKGVYTITASIHTDERFWDDKELYKTKKLLLQEQIRALILQHLGLEMANVLHCMSATSKTFERYINRSQLGGNAIIMKNFITRLPGNDTPFRGLYHVGDSVYPAQGWIGVMMGVKNLERLLDV